MCGIVGFFNPFGLPNQFMERSRFTSALLSLNHRGPDAKGILTSKIAWLGHVRLSIIDPEKGIQPMCSVDRKVAVIFNGEIFNYIELRKEMESRNHSFSTSSDTELLITLYREYGVGMLQKLNGQFAFAIIDFANRILFLARDRVGICPLYYTFVDDTIIFASSMKAITINPEVNRNFNYSALQQLINLWATFGKTTFLKNIYSLLPGEYIQYDQSKFRQAIYWDLQFPDHPKKYSLKEWKEKVYNELNKATSLRLRADVPVASYLSGGLDSSVILKLIHKLHPENFISFSIRFTEKNLDETEYQELVTKQTLIQRDFVKITPQMIADVFEKVIYHAEQPIFRTAPVPYYYLSQLVNRKGYKVVLTGEGADELAWGYNLFKETLMRYYLSKNPHNEKWKSKICKLNPHLPQYNKRYEALLFEYYKKFLNDVDSPLFSHHIKMSNGQYFLNFLNPEIRRQLTVLNISEEIEELLPADFKKWTLLQRTQYIEMKTLLAGYLLSSQGDRMNMAHSVEGRYPFLDHNVIETFASMPDEIKLNGMKEKYILKKTFEDIIPVEIIQRPKYPYQAYEAACLLHSKLEEKYCNEEVNKKYGFFNWKLVEKLRNNLKPGINNTAYVHNTSYVIITSTLIFLEMLNNNFSPTYAPLNKIVFNEIKM